MNTARRMVLALALLGRGAAAPALAAPGAPLTPLALAAQRKVDAPVLFDVSDEATRTKLGVIVGAHLLYGVISDVLGSRLPADKTKPLVFYGGKGDAAQKLAASALAAGHERVSVLQGGLQAWIASGLAVRKLPPAPTAISPAEVHELDQQHQALLVDVREAPERREVIGDSLSLPYSRLESGDPRWSDPLQLSTQTKTVIFYCVAGIRSKRAAELLREQGFASRYFDGPVQWRAAGLPVKPGPVR